MKGFEIATFLSQVPLKTLKAEEGAEHIFPPSQDRPQAEQQRQGERARSSDAASPAADAGRDEPDEAVITQPLTAIVIIFLFFQRRAAELTAQLCQARHLPWRRRHRLPGSTGSDGRERSGSFPLGREGQAQGYQLSSEHTPAPTSLLPQQEAIFKYERLA